MGCGCAGRAWVGYLGALGGPLRCLLSLQRSVEGLRLLACGTQTPLAGHQAVQLVDLVCEDVLQHSRPLSKPASVYALGAVLRGGELPHACPATHVQMLPKGLCRQPETLGHM